MPESDAGVHETVEQHSRVFRDLMLGFIRIHVLHHAGREPIYGAGIFVELARHGYRLSWGTLYPLLHDLTAQGYLAREERVVDGKLRKYYRITPVGKLALESARAKALELVNEIADGDVVVHGGPNGSARARKSR